MAALHPHLQGELRFNEPLAGHTSRWGECPAVLSAEKY